MGNPAEGGAGAGQDDLMTQVRRWKAAVIGFEKMEATVPEVPVQENVFDCGVFVLEYLIHLLKHPASFYTLGLESHREWFAQSVITHRRRRMRDIIAELLRTERVRSAVIQGLTDFPPSYDNEADDTGDRWEATQDSEPYAPAHAASPEEQGIAAAKRLLSPHPGFDDEWNLAWSHWNQWYNQ